MKKNFLLILLAVFTTAAISLIIIQLSQTRRAAVVSENLFNISVSNSLDEVMDQLNRLKVEDYISQNDRYKLIKYKRIEELNQNMQQILQNNSALFYDEKRVHIGASMQDPAVIVAHISHEDSATIKRYNTLLSSRDKLLNNHAFYDQFIDEISEYVVDNLIHQATFNYALIDSLILEQLVLGGIDIRPTIAIYNNTQDTFLHISEPINTELIRDAPFRFSFKPSALTTTDKYYILLRFPTSSLILENTLNKYLFLSIFLLIIITLTFAVAVRIIVSQRKLDDMKSDFINNMTHEVKTPIATVALACEMLEDPDVETDEASRRTYINIIHTENARMQTLAETILLSAKMGKKEYKMKLQEVDVDTLITKTAQSFTLYMKSHNGHLTIDLQAKSHVVGDEMHLRSMINNLIDNAIKYSPSVVDITISSRRDNDNHVVLSISDKGIGISKEDQKHIFEKFYRVSTGDVHNIKGFGIGLNYVSEVVRMHKGTIKVDSELNVGTTFTITLPCL